MAAQLPLKAAKKELRTAMKSRLSSIPTSALEAQSNTAFNALIKLKAYQAAQRISIYLSMPTGEIQTDAIVRHALSAGKQVFVPYLHRNEYGVRADGEDGPRRIMDMVALKGMEDYEGLERDSWGIPTVEGGAAGRLRVLGDEGKGAGVDGGLDLVILPGVAFEIQREGEGKVRRLGHGKGFYDFFLYCYGRVYGQVTPHLYGLALQEQFLSHGEGDRVPMGPHDHLLTGLIVGDGQIVDSVAKNK